MSFATHFTNTNSISNALSQIERVRDFLDAAKLSENWFDAMRSRALLLETYHTTHIEGSQLTRGEAEKILAGKTVPGTSSDDARKLLNHREAFTFALTSLDKGGTINESLIREIHRRLVAGVRGGFADFGAYRDRQSYFVNSGTGEVVFTLPSPHEVPALINQLVRWMNESGNIHPVLVSGIAQFQLMHIQPFMDENGRTSRLLSTLYLYLAGYDFKQLFALSEYYDQHRAAFHSALQGVRQTRVDLTRWLEFYTNGLATQLQEVKNRGERAIRQDELALNYELSDRQALAVAHIVKNGQLKIRDFETLCPNVSRRTLQRDLRVLVNKKLLSEQGRSVTDPVGHYRTGEILLTSDLE
jgi:Fic family protein